MNKEMYLIQTEDYIKHIDDKVRMYGFVKQLVHGISKLPATKGNQKIKEIAVIYGKIIEEQFASWGIPGSYIVTGNAEELTELMENELIEPEDAGYFTAGDECCPDCPYCCDCCGEDEYEIDEEDEDFASAMAALSTIVHEIFGNDVTFHISIE